jgi:hypothetical protein
MAACEGRRESFDFQAENGYFGGKCEHEWVQESIESGDQAGT